MGNPCFFVQNNYIERITARVAQYAHRQGIDVVDRSCISGFDPDKLDIDWAQWHPILPVGSVQFLAALRRSPSFAQYIHHDEESFSSPKCLAEFGDRMLNHSGFLVSAGDIPSHLLKSTLHIRPSKVDKAFTAKVFDSDSWADTFTKRELEHSLECWASPPVSITGEWRCWVVNGQVVDISRYREGDHMAINRDVPEEVRAYAASNASGWMPAPVVVMDIAETTTGLRIIEFNPFHSSGWYAGDENLILTAWLEWSLERYKA